ncbi:Helix-loop-helix DNA-Hypothetical protein domain [Nesidiocoris tenuis]|uniref:BHLH domain-containing protein n=1 Tax=Nesidiocoris tenuis TaxID=355587 RepID=A0ABN7BH70_9HEMI|nr:Helix-loop-helix DNA-Hypothetical protein domain [Nesidiocoris tenuis]
MVKKKPVIKSRDWEKERRKKLNICFDDLSRLLPEHDPAITLSKMEILKKAAEYIRQLQKQNEEIFGSNDELKNEAERCKEQVAHLIVRTKVLVKALQTAGIRLPDDQRKSRAKAKSVVLKDQNCIPTTSVLNPVQPFPSAQTMVLDNNAKNVTHVVRVTPPKAKNVSSSHRTPKKNPFGENGANVVIPPASTVPVISGNVATNVVLTNELPNAAAILNPNIATNLQAPAMCPGAFIIRDGRVITVPSILVRPQPTVILMQATPVRQTAAGVKRVKLPQNILKGREVTQTTYANKAPIPAIKAFRMESYPREYKGKSKKKKDDPTLEGTKKSTSCSDQSAPVCASSNMNDGTTKSLSVNTPLTCTALTSLPGSSSVSNLKRKAVPSAEGSKVSKLVEKPSTAVSGDSCESCLEKTQPECASHQTNTSEAGNTSKTLTNQQVIGVQQPQHRKEAIRQTLLAKSSVCAQANKNNDQVGGDLGQPANIMDMEIALEESGITVNEKLDLIGDKILNASDRIKETPKVIEAQESQLTRPAGLSGAELWIQSGELGNSNGEGSNLAGNSNIEETDTSKMESGKQREDSLIQSAKPQDQANDRSNPSVEETSAEVSKRPKEKPTTANSTLQLIKPCQAMMTSSRPANPSAEKEGMAERTVPDSYSPSPAATESESLPTNSKLTDSIKPQLKAPPNSSSTTAQSTSSSSATLKASNPFLHDNNPFLYQDANNQNACWPSSSGTYDFNHPMVPVGKSVGCSTPVGCSTSTLNTNPNISASCSSGQNVVSTTTSSMISRSTAAPCQRIGNESSPNLTAGGRNVSLQSGNAQTGGGAKHQITTSGPQTSCTNAGNNASNQQKSALVESTFPSTYSYTLSNHMYSIALPAVNQESARPESFFNYENPIANLPTADPYFSNLANKRDNIPMSCTTSAATINCSSYASQSSNSRQPVARKLFSGDSLCTVANSSYSLLNTHQNQSNVPMPPLPPISTNPTQMFHVGSYSNINTFRDPVYFPNDAVVVSKSSCSSQPSAKPCRDPAGHVNQSTNFGELHPHTTYNSSFPSISCNTNLSANITTPNSSYIPSRPYGQIEPPPCYPSQTSNTLISYSSSQALNVGASSKSAYKSYNRSADFSMNVITSNGASGPPSNASIGAQDSFNHNTISSSSNQDTSKLNASTQLEHNKIAEPKTTAELSQKKLNNNGTLQYSNFQYFNSSHHSTSTQSVYQGDSSGKSKTTMPPPPPPSQAKDGLELAHLSSLSSPATSVHNQQQSTRSKISTQSGPSLNGLSPRGPKEPPTAPVSAAIQKANNQLYTQSVASHTYKHQYFREEMTANASMTKDATIQASSTNSPHASSNSQGVQTHLSYVLHSNSQKSTSLQRSSSNVMPTPSNIFTSPSGHTQVASQTFLPSMTSNNQPCSSTSMQHAQKQNGSQNRNSLTTTNYSSQLCSQQHYNAVPNTTNTPNKTPNLPGNSVQSGSSSSMHVAALPSSTNYSYSYPSSSTVPHSVHSNPTSVVTSQQEFNSFNLNCSTAQTADFMSNQNMFAFSHISSTNHTTPGERVNAESSALLAPASQLFSNTESMSHQNQSHLRQEVVASAQKHGVDAARDVGVQQNGQSAYVHEAGSNNLICSGPGDQTNLPANSKKSHQSFSMSHIATCTSSHNPESSSDSPNQGNQSTKSNASPSQNYSSILKENSFKAAPSQNLFGSADAQGPPVSKSYDFPLASVLTGLNDPILSSSMISNEINSNLQNRNMADPVQSTKHSKCSGKDIERHFIGNSEGNSYKPSDNSCVIDYQHRSKDIERNSFIPIIEDVRLNSEFSNDLFSSLQVPTGGTHSDSISPTAAFLLAFPLVSTSKNNENPNENDQQDNTHGNTPTTILQIGNIDPPNSELFHPLEFTKDIENSVYLGQIHDKAKRKDLGGVDKQKKTDLNSFPPTSAYGCQTAQPSEFNVVQYDQSWTSGGVETIVQNKNKIHQDRRKVDKPVKQFNNNVNANFEYCKSDKKKKNKISVNWMATTEVNEPFHKEVEASFAASTLPFPIDMDSFPDICLNKKANSNNGSAAAYNWSPSKSLLPFDSTLVIPSTLPTLMGDLALGTLTPSDSYGKRSEIKKSTDKPLAERREAMQKTQNNFFSVSQLVDPKSKKSRVQESNKFKKLEKKKATAGANQRRKDLGGGEVDACQENALPPMGWEKYRHRNNYSAEALIGGQEVVDSTSYTAYQQQQGTNNFFVGPDFNSHPDTQAPPLNGQYQANFSFTNQYPSYASDEYQQPSEAFSVNQQQQTTPSQKQQTVSKQNIGQHMQVGNSNCKRTTAGPSGANNKMAEEQSESYANNRSQRSTYLQDAHAQTHQHQSHSASLSQTQPASSGPPVFTSNTTTSVTNFNLSTIFPEINERTGPQTHARQSTPNQRQQASNVQHHNSVNSCTNNPLNSYRNI